VGPKSYSCLLMRQHLVVALNCASSTCFLSSRWQGTGRSTMFVYAKLIWLSRTRQTHCISNSVNSMCECNHLHFPQHFLRQPPNICTSKMLSDTRKSLHMGWPIQIFCLLPRNPAIVTPVRLLNQGSCLPCHHVPPSIDIKFLIDIRYNDRNCRQLWNG